jgi:antirestriction protein ArdC
MQAQRGAERQAQDPLLSVDSFFAASQICGVAPRVKMYHSNSSMRRSIKMIRQLEQIFELFCMIFRELKGKKKPQ